MTYISAQPYMSTNWEDICYPVSPVWLSDILPDYDIIATDRQQLIVGEPLGGRKTVFGIQSADYAIISNILIKEIVDELFPDYTLQIKHTATGEFSISIIFPQQVSIGGERVQRSIILTNSYNGKTPFTIQGQTLTAMMDNSAAAGSSLYRDLCKNGLMGWADSFGNLSAYRSWLTQSSPGKEKKKTGKSLPAVKGKKDDGNQRKIHHSRLSPELFQQQLREMLSNQAPKQSTLTETVYEHLQQKTVSKADENIFKSLPIPVQLAKQAHERMRLEQRLLGADTSYWLMYNAVNHALFNARSSLTLNDRYKLDERVFHQIAVSSFA
ncbi:hypothetical protein L0657_08825 [Dyadobacter sp. CY345]|uniref:hypothetical protein n=1 Tax=Dyadobacter sp. CY345 TaxID=2909335 RepID=UPI001F243DBE|nr:hypothetical protein [Dyadobacter sp. CY345]MCF2444057.1 hypothetical protein [Dyadobacter sp. CY345]